MGQTLRIALAQVAVGPEREDNVAKALRMMADAAQAGAQLIIFPEMSVDPFFPQYRAEQRFFDWGIPVPGPLTDRFQAEARRLSLATVINVFERAAPGRYYDCSPVFDYKGNYLGKQRMVHILEGPGYNERYYYWQGDTGYPVFDLGLARIGVAICYDRHFPEGLRALVLGGADVIVVPTATASLEVRFRAVWEIEMQAAAVANGVFVAVVNRAGVDDTLTFFGRSFAVDPYGRVLARAPEDDVALLLIDLDLGLIEQARRDMPFLRDRRPETYSPLVEH
ncbi:MAG TPA: nitrilase-related carbon-nitrogen hydrolase [Anaerolineae bacterium]|nr:nitrilase-related carbon-nitrogen hydrolase [Anaerolineae bacterium]